jgi:SH3 domain protein
MMTKTRKFWAPLFYVHAVLLYVPSVMAQPAGSQQYISDDINVTIRQKPSNDAESIGMVRSGARVRLLESLGSDSFAHIRTADGRDGWISARYLSGEPGAKDQLIQLRQQLEQARSQGQSLQRDLDAAQQQLAKAKPALEMAADNDRLRAAITRGEQKVGELEQQFDAEQARRQTLVTGGILICGGMAAGLLLPWLGGRKRRYGSF